MQVFQPPGCAYYQYTRRQVQEHFQQNNVDIVVVGDSIVRQLFARAVHMLRGQVGTLQHLCQSIAWILKSLAKAKSFGLPVCSCIRSFVTMRHPRPHLPDIWCHLCSARPRCWA